jgi:hypothetical protein
VDAKRANSLVIYPNFNLMKQTAWVWAPKTASQCGIKLLNKAQVTKRIGWEEIETRQSPVSMQRKKKTARKKGLVTGAARFVLD